jgi:para-aminobenzoate synthetase / 4-amino-4-deoxychorismate lyase
MILDLLRNDLGRISKFGSVRVRKIFAIEKYETLYQMVSEVESELREEIKFSDVIKNIFPCGSVTGAPKIRTMEIINELEEESRGIYTGAVGLIHQDKIKFNVAIRTMEINPKSGEGELGIGSGVVWDSEPEKEYDEVILKSNFLLNPIPYFELFETMKYENGTIVRLAEHFERLKETASYFLFKYKPPKSPEWGLLNDREYRIRMVLNKNGEIKFEHKTLEELPSEIKIIISDKIVSTQNLFQYFKTTNRKLYNDEHTFYSLKGFYDVIFINEKNQVTEGAISNIFIKKGGLWYTPPVSCGILPGVFRKLWLRKDINVKEDVLYKDDLLIADEIVMTNSLRGKVKVDKLYLNESEFKEFSNLLVNSNKLNK